VRLVIIVAAIGGGLALLQASSNLPTTLKKTRAFTGAVESRKDLGNEAPEMEPAWDMLEELALSADAAPLGAPSQSTWQSSCDVLPQSCAGDPMADLAKDRLLAHPARIMARTQLGLLHSVSVAGESVFYNPTALTTIRNCGGSAGAACSNGVHFPDGSIVGRFAWMHVQKDQPCPIVYVFNPLKDAANFGASDDILLDTGNCPNPLRLEAHQLTDFLHVPIGKNVLSFRTANGAVLQKTDIAVILGIHLMRKQSGTWQWATFWWSAEPHQAHPTANTGYPCDPSSHCPMNLQMPHEWDHYVASSVRSPSNNQAKFLSISNPYLEPKGAARMNCIVCHSFAMTPKNPNAGMNIATRCGAQSAVDTTTANLDTSSESYRISCSPSRISTDGVWTVAEYLKLGSKTSCDSKVCPNDH
jgi:hypothetical protein